jgi:mannosyltransferase
LALRLFHLGTQSLWYDEGYSVYLAGKSLGQLTWETANDIQPPLYYYLLHFWLRAFGTSEAGVRSLSLLFGVLSLPLFYLLARRLFDERTGWVAAGLAALSPLHLWYAQETRMYTLLVALTLASSYLLWLALTEARPAARRWLWAGWAVATVLALYTHYFAAFVVVFQVICAILAWWRQAQRTGATRVYEPLAALIIVVLAYTPWLPFLLGRYGSDTSYWAGQLKLDEAVRKVGISFSVGESVVEEVGQWLAVGFALALVVAVVALIWSRRGALPGVNVASRGSGLIFLLLYLTVPIILLLATTYSSPKFSARYAMPASPPFFILLAAGWTRLTRKSIAARAVVLLMVAFVLGAMAYADYSAFFDIRFTKPDFRGAVHWVEAHQAPDEAVILTSGHAFPVFTYYYRGNNWYPIPPDRTLTTQDTLTYAVAQDLNRALTGKRGVWLVLWQDEVVDPNGYLTFLLDQYAQPQPVEGSFYHVRVQHYALPPDVHFPEQAAIDRPLNLNFGNEVTLLGVSPGVTQTLSAYWQASHPLGSDHKVSLRLKDAAGLDWGRSDADRRLAALLYPTNRWRPGETVVSRYLIPAAPGTPPGVYDLEATVYAEGAPQALDVLDARGAPAGKTARLGQITLTRPQPAVPADFGLTGGPLVSWDGWVTLAGDRLNRTEVQAGDQVHLSLFWQVLDAMPADCELRVQWSQSGQERGVQAFAPAGAAYPTSKWQPGDLLRGQYSLDVPLSVEAGAAELRVGLFAAGQAAPFNEWQPLASVKVQPTQRVFVAPPLAYPVNANFEDRLSLLGANLSPAGAVRAGDHVTVSLYWKALARMTTSYTTFVHLLDNENRIRTQEDRIPAAGARPTTGWVGGEIVEDKYELVVSPDAPAAEYAIEVGVYNANDPAFPRLSVLEDGQPKENRVVVAKVEVR